MPDIDSTTMQAVKKTQEDHEEQLLSRENVVGVGIGSKEKDGNDTGEIGITVFVSQKLRGSDLEILKEKDKIPPTLGDFKTDVVETGEIFAGAEPRPAVPVLEADETELATPEAALEVLRRPARPAMGGQSVGHFRITAGTIATAVYDASAFPGIPPKYYILSNNHVLANTNDARIGDPILQPGPADGGIVGRDTIAHLTEFVRIRFLDEPDNHKNFVDAAIAEGSFQDLDRRIYWIGHVRGATEPKIGMAVHKTGRTTCYTTGRIRAINATVDVNYGGGRVARFVRQILTTNMTAGSDSGSLLIDMDSGRAVGLMFAGSSRVTVHNDIRYVQRMLGIKIA